MPRNRPYIVAEVSANHHGSLDRCLKIIDAAKEAGADAVKFQTYTPESMVAYSRYVVAEGPWKGNRLLDLYKRAMTPLEWHPNLFNYCHALGIDCFSTPFDDYAVDLLEDLGCERYKIASFELTDTPLLEKVSKTGKPIILSTGMATIEEIQAALSAISKHSLATVTLLKCTSAYPAEPKDANLAAMEDMRSRFSVPVGLSDHSRGIGVAVAASVMGASVIEKHLTLDEETGPDSHFSMRPAEFELMVKTIRVATEAIGEVRYGTLESEAASSLLKRSIYAATPIRRGEQITEGNTRLCRPALGIPASEYVKAIGKRSKQPIEPGDPITWEMVE